MRFCRTPRLVSTGISIALAVVCGAAEQPFVVRIDAGPGGFITPGAESAAALVIASRLGHPVHATVAVTSMAFDGSKQVKTQECDLPATGACRMPVPLGDARTGIRWLSYTVTGDGQQGTGSVSCLYATPTGPGTDPAGFLYGVSAHLMGQRDREDQLRAASAVGIRVIRDDAHWDRLEPESGMWNWEPLDDLVALGDKYGLEYEMILCYGNAFAAVPAAQAAYAEAMQRNEKDAWLIRSRAAQDDHAWRAFSHAIGARYQGRIHLWEVWNEPDLAGFFRGTTDDYIRMLRSAYAELKAVDPQSTVLSGGFATVTNHQGRKLNPDLQERVLVEASDAFDVHAYHGHGSFSSFQASVDGELTRIRSRMPVSKPLYFNETALTAAFNGERIQAIALVKKLAFARARGAIGYTWYDLRNDGNDPAEGEHNYGLLTSNLQPKAVYAVYNELIHRMRGKRYIGELALGAGRHGYVFAGDGQRLAVVWNEDAALADEPVVLRAAGCAGGTVIDLMGNGTPLPARGGALLVCPRGEPTYIELPGGEAMPEVAGPLIAIDGGMLAEPGEPAPLVARVANPLAEPLTIQVEWDGPGATKSQRMLTVPAGDKGQFPLPAICPADATALTRSTLAFRYLVVGGPWSGTLMVPLQVGHRVLPGGPERSPDFTIDTQAAVVNFCEADPALAAQTWHGPDDLSARIWLQRQDAALHVHVAVRDDIHFQAEDAGSAWRGDGLQVAFQVPGQKGFWEIGAASANDGKLLRSVWSRPVGAIGRTGGGADDIRLDCHTVEGGMIYDIDLPYTTFGLSDAILDSGLRFNLIVNDNDGPLRKGFIRIAPGIGESKNPELFPLLRFQKRATP